MRRRLRVTGSLMMCALAMAVACERQSSSPAAPSGASPAATNAAPDGSTLKVDAPQLVSAINGVRLETDKATLVLRSVSSPYLQEQTLTYRVQLMSNGGAVIEERTGSALSYAMNSTLEFDTLYKWRARAELADAFGPWSVTESFRSIDKKLGYIQGNELYDPLIEGVTVGRINGSATFVPGVGLRINEEETFVEYTLPQTLVAGEFSVLATNIFNVSNNEDPKLRLISMREGGAPFNDNPFRMSLEKRGNGAIAWRFLTGSPSYIETNSAERNASIYRFQASATYFVRVQWGGNTFRVLIQEGGVGGTTIYETARGYDGQYRPNPHNVYLGSPYARGDRGEAASLDNVIIRQVWVSPNPRPSFANK